MLNDSETIIKSCHLTNVSFADLPVGSPVDMSLFTRQSLWDMAISVDRV